MRELRELALGGVLLTSWAVADGWPRSSLFRRLREEGWAALGEGAWAVPGRAPGLRARLRATQLAAPGLVVSHRAAAWLWRIEVLRVEAEFTDPDGLRKRKHVRVHRCAMRPEDVVVSDGLRVTSVDRTLADLLVACPRDEVLVAVESALAHRTVTDGGSPLRRAPRTRLDRVAASLGERSHGSVRARRHLALADPASGSPAETVARLRMYDAGLRPETQASRISRLVA